jgi:hypothetical protein
LVKTIKETAMRRTSPLHGLDYLGEP